MTLSIFLVCVNDVVRLVRGDRTRGADFRVDRALRHLLCRDLRKEAFMMVLEKKVSTSKTARNIMATVLTHSRLLRSVSIVPYPFTEPAYVMPSTR